MKFRVMKVSVVSLITAVAFCCAGALAVNAASLKVGVMDTQKVVTECNAGKKAKQNIEKKQKELQGSVDAEQKAVKELKDEIEKKSTVWTKEKKDEKVLEFNKMQRELQANVENARLEMKQVSEKETGPVLKALETIIKDYGKSKKYTLILDSRAGVHYFDDSVDISDDLIKELNKQL